MKLRMVFLIFVGLAGLALLVGCGSTKSFEYHPDSEIPRGPGIFSGKKGDFTLYDSKRTSNAAVGQQSPADDGSQEMSPDERAAFRQFQEWKKDQKEFEAFQEWKRSQQGSQEYQDFQEWKRWRAYKRWNDEQRESNKIDY